MDLYNFGVGFDILMIVYSLKFITRNCSGRNHDNFIKCDLRTIIKQDCDFMRPHMLQRMIDIIDLYWTQQNVDNSTQYLGCDISSVKFDYGMLQSTWYLRFLLDKRMGFMFRLLKFNINMTIWTTTAAKLWQKNWHFTFKSLWLVSDPILLLTNDLVSDINCI